MIGTAIMRLVTENRQGLCCISYLTFHVSGSVRRRRNISFSDGKLLGMNGFGHLRGEGTIKLLYKLTIDKMDERRRRK